MPLTHHPVRLFRLSCGCLREYPMMSATVQHLVLCITCRQAVMTVLAYPERRCGARGHADARFPLSCTLPRAECNGRWHFDDCASIWFATVTPKLAAVREGRTGRA